MVSIKYFSMFSGIGGFELGIQRAMDNKYASEKQQDREGRNRSTDEQSILLCSPNNTALCVGYSEIDKYSIQTYEKNFRGHKNYGDATKINPETIPDFDILVGGFPCQAFSIAGKRGGFEDTRGTLFFEIARIIKGKQPRLFILENVKGLLNHDGGNTFTKILQTIDELGYDAEWQVLNSKNFGVPQNRERVFIIGRLRGTGGRQIFPLSRYRQQTISKNAYKISSINGLIKSKVYPCLDTMYKKGLGSKQPRACVLKEITKNVSDAQRIYTTSCAKTLKGDGGGQGAKTGLYAVLTPERFEKRQNGRRFKDDGEPSFTLTGQDVHGVYDGVSIRRLTPVECERLQGFPDNFTDGVSDTQRYKQLGNAVTVNVVEAIISELLTNNNI